MRHVLAALAVIGTAVTVAVLGPSSRQTVDVPARYAGITAEQRAIVKLAYRYGPRSGLRYVFGAASPRYGFDCSGYVIYVYRHALNIELYHWVQAIYYDQRLRLVDRGDERPGDLVFFNGVKGNGWPGHMGIYVGAGMMIDYYSSGRPARIVPLASHAGYVAAKRLAKVPRVPRAILPKTIAVARRFHVRVRGAQRFTVTFTRNRAITRWLKHTRREYRAGYDTVTFRIPPPAPTPRQTTGR